MTNVITAQDISDFAPDLDTSAYSATTMSGLIAQVTRKMANFCNVRGFDVTTYTEKDRAHISNNGELIVSTHTRPLLSVSSIVLSHGQFSTTLTLSDSAGNLYYDIPFPGNKLVFPNSYLFATGTYLAGAGSQLLSLKQANLFASITYVAGFSPIPDDLKDAALLWVQDIIMRKINRAGVQSFTQGSLSMTFGKNAMDGDSPLVKQAKSILMAGDYVRPDIF